MLIQDDRNVCRKHTKKNPCVQRLLPTRAVNHGGNTGACLVMRRKKGKIREESHYGLIFAKILETLANEAHLQTRLFLRGGRTEASRTKGANKKNMQKKGRQETEKKVTEN